MPLIWLSLHSGSMPAWLRSALTSWRLLSTRMHVRRHHLQSISGSTASAEHKLSCPSTRHPRALAPHVRTWTGRRPRHCLGAACVLTSSTQQAGPQTLACARGQVEDPGVVEALLVGAHAAKEQQAGALHGHQGRPAARGRLRGALCWLHQRPLPDVLHPAPPASAFKASDQAARAMCARSCWAGSAAQNAPHRTPGSWLASSQF